MKKKFLYRFALALAISGAVVACSKNNNSNNANDSSTDLQTQSSDQTQVSNENDAVFSDVETTMSYQASITGASSGINGTRTTFGVKDTIKSIVCDATTILDTVSNPHTLTLSYNGSTNCSGTRTRTGTVVISWAAGTKWADKGATITVSIQNLKITRIGDGKSLTLNGTHLYTNVTGGSLASLYYNSEVTSVTHTVTSDDMSITFDNGATRTWHVARQRTYTYSEGYIATTTGLHTDGSTSGISEWGTNRFGNSFETIINANNPLVISQACSYQLISGEVSIVRPAVTTTLTFGLDANGDATGCPVDGGTYYFQLVWAGSGGKTYTFILPY